VKSHQDWNAKSIRGLCKGRNEFKSNADQHTVHLMKDEYGDPCADFRSIVDRRKNCISKREYTDAVTNLGGVTYVLPDN
jgi:hypothetical protein